MGAKAKLGKKLLGVAGNVAKTVLKSTPVGGVASTLIGVAGSLKGSKTGVRRRKRGVTYYLRKIPVEKAKARLQKIKMSAYKGL